MQLFRDNSHVGRFVNSLAADLESWRPSSSLLPSSPNTNDGERSVDATAPLHPAIPTPTSTPPKGDSAFRNDDVSWSVTTPMATPDGAGAGVMATSCAVSPCKAPAAALRSSLSSGAGSERETAKDRAPQCCEGDAAHSVEALNAGAAAVGAAAGGEGGGAGGALESLWVNDGSGRTVLFADVSVYTRCVLLSTDWRHFFFHFFFLWASLELAGSQKDWAARSAFVAAITGHLYC